MYHFPSRRWVCGISAVSSFIVSIADANHSGIENVNTEQITLSWQVGDVHEVHNVLQEAGVNVKRGYRRLLRVLNRISKEIFGAQIVEVN